MKRMGLIILVLVFFLSAQAAQADWTPAKRLTWTSSYSYAPAIVVDSSDFLHVIWYDFTPGNWEIYYKKSTDGGASWAKSRRLTSNSGTSAVPDMAVDSSGNLHVVWVDLTPGNAEIYYKKSTDGGASWTTSKRLTWTSGNSYAPAVAAGPSGNLHVVWYDETPGNNEIFYKKSTDGGASWTTAKRLTWTADTTAFPDVAVDPSGNPHVVWEDRTPGNAELYYRKSADAGTNWATSQRLTWTSGWSQYPSIVLDPSGDPHVVWHDFTPGNAEIYYKKSTDGGDSWAKSQRLTWTADTSDVPVIAAGSSSHLHVVWYDQTPGNWELYYIRSTDAGATWSTSQRLTWSSGISESPSLAVDSSGKPHVVWDDDTPGNAEIFYKREN